jgi:hypothetical protein
MASGEETTLLYSMSFFEDSAPVEDSLPKSGAKRSDSRNSLLPSSESKSQTDRFGELTVTISAVPKVLGIRSQTVTSKWTIHLDPQHLCATCMPFANTLQELTNAQRRLSSLPQEVSSSTEGTSKFYKEGIMISFSGKLNLEFSFKESFLIRMCFKLPDQCILVPFSQLGCLWLIGQDILGT